jgi:hypothetical protein
MARYPGAIWKPITASKGRNRLTVWNRVNLHIAVSESDSLFTFFNKSGIPDSHFYVRRDGKVEQYVDTAWNAFADLEGNDATISIETQGGATGEWTAAQRESLARLFAWAVKTHGIAQKLATSSKVGSSESRGLSWHRLGIDGNFPALPSILAGRLQRGAAGIVDRDYMHYSNSFGKGCPTDDRIKQIPGILKRALEILSPPAPSPVPTPTPEDDMPTAKEIADAVWSKEAKVPSNLVPFLGEYATMESIVKATAFRAEDIETDVDTVIQELRSHDTDEGV